MTNQLDNLDREQWLTQSAQLIIDEIISPQLPADYSIPYNFRVSVGFPPRSRVGSKMIACCISASASADQHNEIFISPTIDNSADILGALVHELCHYADNCESGHRNFFARLARRVGLLGKFTATHASDELIEYFATIIDLLGPIPHAALDINTARQKQVTRMIKVMCDACGFHFRATQTQIERITVTDCPACQAGTMVI